MEIEKVNKKKKKKERPPKSHKNKKEGALRNGPDYDEADQKKSRAYSIGCEVCANEFVAFEVAFGKVFKRTKKTYNSLKRTYLAQSHFDKVAFELRGVQLPVSSLLALQDQIPSLRFFNLPKYWKEVKDISQIKKLALRDGEKLFPDDDDADADKNNKLPVSLQQKRPKISFEALNLDLYFDTHPKKKEQVEEAAEGEEKISPSNHQLRIVIGENDLRKRIERFMYDNKLIIQWDEANKKKRRKFDDLALEKPPQEEKGVVRRGPKQKKPVDYIMKKIKLSNGSSIPVASSSQQNEENFVSCDEEEEDQEIADHESENFEKIEEGVKEEVAEGKRKTFNKKQVLLLNASLPQNEDHGDEEDEAEEKEKDYYLFKERLDFKRNARREKKHEQKRNPSSNQWSREKDDNQQKRISLGEKNDYHSKPHSNNVDSPPLDEISEEEYLYSLLLREIPEKQHGGLLSSSAAFNTSTKKKTNKESPSIVKKTTTPSNNNNKKAFEEEKGPTDDDLPTKLLSSSKKNNISFIDSYSALSSSIQRSQPQKTSKEASPPLEQQPQPTIFKGKSSCLSALATTTPAKGTYQKNFNAGSDKMSFSTRTTPYKPSGGGGSAVSATPNTTKLFTTGKKEDDISTLPGYKFLPKLDLRQMDYQESKAQEILERLEQEGKKRFPLNEYPKLVQDFYKSYKAAGKLVKMIPLFKGFYGKHVDDLWYTIKALFSYIEANASSRYSFIESVYGADQDTLTFFLKFGGDPTNN